MPRDAREGLVEPRSGQGRRRCAAARPVDRGLLRVPPGTWLHGRSDGRRVRPCPRDRRVRAQHWPLLRAGPAALGLEPHELADRRDELVLRESAPDRHDAVHAVALLQAPRLVPVRPQHVHDRDGPCARRLHGVPHRAAALPAGVGLHRHGLELRRHAHRQHRERALQPVRGDPEHARRVRAHGRLHRRGSHADPLAAPALVLLPGARLDRGRRDREPLLDRCRPRRDRRGDVLLRRHVPARSCASRGVVVALARGRGGRGRRLTPDAPGPPSTERPTSSSSSRRRNGVRGRGEPWTAADIREQARNRLIESRLTPNAISMTGFVGNVIAAVLVTQRYFFLAGIAFILGSVCDTLDGRYSRMSGKGTPFGAFLDSTLDRVEEGIVLTAVAAYFSSRGNDLAVAAVVVTVLMSLMVSYTRARAEALGVECKVGLATRPVRVVILSAGLLFAKGASLGDFELLEPAIYVMAVLTTFTTFQRVLHVRRELNKQPAS